MKTLLILGLGVCVLPGLAAAEQRLVIDPGVDLGGGLFGYTLRFEADSDDEVLAGWDGSFDGPMNQILFAGTVPTPSLEMAGYLSDYDRARDSHFLLYNADLVAAESPSESPSLLTMGAGIQVASRTRNFSLAQIVLGEGQTVTMSGHSADPWPNLYVNQATITGGGECLALCYPAAEDGGADAPLGASVAVTGSGTDPEYVYRVWHRCEALPGMWAEGVVAVFDQPSFTFDADQEGEYWVTYGPRDLILGESSVGPSLSFQVIPEPATLAVLAAGAFALLRRRLR